MMQHVFAPGTELLRHRRARGFTIFGRLKDGVTLREADSALRVVAAELLRQDPRH